MPGNPRYQPKSMIPFFGYDRYAYYLMLVEFALLDSLADIGIIPKSHHRLLTRKRRAAILSSITTTKMDKLEKAKTKHDIRALVQLMQRMLPLPLRKWVHVPATSYDIVDTARTLAFREAFNQVTLPTLNRFIVALTDQVEKNASVLQIGRTHCQHALPITVGFWLASLLNRFLDTRTNLIYLSEQLCGKMSGAVGAYNAQEGLNIEATYRQWKKSRRGLPKTFEGYVLSKLGLEAAPISTQVVPPEPLTRFLNEMFLLSGCFAQLGHDVRNLQRPEINEVAEAFAAGQVGSSTMAHKRNPIVFENLVAVFRMVKGYYTMVMDCLLSDHQRDLTTSATLREFPSIVVLTQYQIERAIGAVTKMTVNQSGLERCFAMSANLILAEPIYIALQMAGYSGDAHHLVNHTLVPKAIRSGRLLVEELEMLAAKRPTVRRSFRRIPPKVIQLLHNPGQYTGRASRQALATARRARKLLTD